MSAALAVCDGLTRPPAACLSTVRGARARCVRPTSASHCFDYEHSRHIRSQLLFEACASPLRPRACTLDDGDWGTWRFTTPDPLRRVVSGWGAASSSAHSRLHRASDIPVAFPRPPVACASESLPSLPRPCWQAFREEPPARRSGMPSTDGLPRHARFAPSLENGHVSFRFDEGASVSSPAAAYLRTLERRARRPSLNASRSGEMEVRPLLCAGHCPSTSATTSNDARARPRASDPRPPRHEDPLFEESPCRRAGPRLPCASFDVPGVR